MVSQAERRKATIDAILGAARKLFARDGFEATTIDDIAKAGGVAKGAVYHHFRSKEEILEQVLETMQAELAAEVPIIARAAKDPLDGIYKGTLKYLSAASEKGTRRILLIDGPAVLGWDKWREIDQRHFAHLLKVPMTVLLKDRMKPREIDALCHLVTGAMTEAALVCAVSDNPERDARDLALGIKMLLESVVKPRVSGGRAPEA